MQPRVTAILVARNGAQFLDRTLRGLGRQSRRPDSVVFVDCESTDASQSMLVGAASASQFVVGAGRNTFGTAVASALSTAVPRAEDNEWLWLLAHDNAPEAGALAALLGAVEIAPSVAVAGPKLMRWTEPDVISSYGETITPFGASVSLVAGELDQAQHDRHSDLLGVAAGGMLVRRSVWAELGGFDPSLPTVDAALDFCIRVRLAGHRIVGVPAARVLSAGGPETFARAGAHPSNTASRFAQLHRRLTYSPALALPLHWLSILPLVVFRSIWQLLAKRPGAVGGEFSAGFAALVDTRVTASRRNLARTRRLGWGAIAPLRMPWGQVRELRAHQRDQIVVQSDEAAVVTRPSFFSSGGAWIVILLAAIGLVAFGTLVGAPSLIGGALSPLSSTVADLWNNVGYGWRHAGAGVLGAADPFAAVLAVLGTLFFWSPTSSIVVLYLSAIPLAAIAAWWCASRFSSRGWAPAVAAIAWSLAPPFLASLNAGHLGSVIAHILLPWLVLALVGSARSWSAAAAASLLFAVIAASAPVLVPVLVLGWLAWSARHATRLYRLIGIPIPALALFLPLVIEQFSIGNPLGLLADPGVPFVAGTDSGWQLAIGAADGASNGWIAVAESLGLAWQAGTAIVAVLLLPLAVLALLALFLPSTRRAIPALAVAAGGFVTAVASAHIAVTAVGAEPVSIWPGSGLSVFWLGLVGAAVVTLDAIGRCVALPALALAVTASVLAFPLLASVALDTSAVTESRGRLLPAYVAAKAAVDPALGTLVLDAQPDGGLSATLSRGEGTTLDDQSTLEATSVSATTEQKRIATIAANLASKSGFDSAAELTALHLAFVVVRDDDSGRARATRERAAESLDANPILTPIGQTDNGYLWHFEDVGSTAQAVRPGPLDTGTGLLVAGVQALVFLIAILLAIPTSRRFRPRVVSSSDEPATTFDEEDND